MHWCFYLPHRDYIGGKRKPLYGDLYVLTYGRLALKNDPPPAIESAVSLSLITILLHLSDSRHGVDA